MIGIDQLSAWTESGPLPVFVNKSFIGKQPYYLVHILSLAAFVPHQQSLVVQRPYEPQILKGLLSCPLYQSFDDS